MYLNIANDNLDQLSKLIGSNFIVENDDRSYFQIIVKKDQLNEFLYYLIKESVISDNGILCEVFIDYDCPVVFNEYYGNVQTTISKINLMKNKMTEYLNIEKHLNPFSDEFIIRILPMDCLLILNNILMLDKDQRYKNLCHLYSSKYYQCYYLDEKQYFIRLSKENIIDILTTELTKTDELHLIYHLYEYDKKFIEIKAEKARLDKELAELLNLEKLNKIKKANFNKELDKLLIIKGN